MILFHAGPGFAFALLVFSGARLPDLSESTKTMLAKERRQSRAAMTCPQKAPGGSVRGSLELL